MASRTEVNGGGHFLYRVTVGDNFSSTASTELKKIVENAYRSGGENCTIWLDVQANRIPAYALQSLSSLKGLPAGIVLTHAECCSHGRGRRLPADVLRIVAGLGRDGKVWHPLENRMVTALLQE